MTRWMMTLLVLPFLFANAACSKNDSTKVRGLNPTEKPSPGVKPQELVLKSLNKTFTEADFMFDQIWAAIHERSTVKEIKNQFSIVSEAIDATLLREQNQEKIECERHENGTEFLLIEGVSPTLLVQKITCVNSTAVKQTVVRIQQTTGKNQRWEFKASLLKEELGQVFVSAVSKRAMTCDASVAKDGIIEQLSCQNSGLSVEQSTTEYILFDKYKYIRSGQRTLVAEGKRINIVTNKAVSVGKLIVPKEGDVTLEKREEETETPEVVTTTTLPVPVKPSRLVPTDGEVPAIQAATPAITGTQMPAVEAAPKAGSDAAKLGKSEEELAAEAEMDRVIEQYCTEKELEFVKKQVHSKAEIADSCAAGQIIREEVQVDQLPSTR